MPRADRYLQHLAAVPMFQACSRQELQTIGRLAENYKVDAGTQEPLIVDTTNGALKYLDDPVTVGTTQFNIYQYVTWHDDPAINGTHDYKRVVEVVTKFE